MNKGLYRAITNLKYEIKEMAKKIDMIDQVINDKTFKETAVNNFFEETLWDFPIKSVEELEDFEKHLLDDNFKKKVVKKNLYLYSYFKINQLLLIIRTKFFTMKG